MGGAFTAVAEDENALFYNPAGLSEISTLQLGAHAGQREDRRYIDQPSADKAYK